ncbi:hypothetical protein [Streptomyces virginiae]
MDAEEPLMLPLEAIDLDACRQRHEHDTFWCGLFLGGCGVQLATKLYPDRVCHFAQRVSPSTNRGSLFTRESRACAPLTAGRET